MAIVLFDNHSRDNLYPLSVNHAVADLRCGIFSFKERWEYITGQKVFIHTPQYLRPLYETIPYQQLLWIDASVLPDAALAKKILLLEPNTALGDAENVLAANMHVDPSLFNNSKDGNNFATIASTSQVRRLQYPWQIFQWNEEWIRNDFALITAKEASQPVPAGNQCAGNGNIFIGEDASVNFSMINASGGPVYIGKNATVMEGCTIRGPVAICDDAVIKMGTKLYSGTTIGPHCVAGGEIKNSVLQAFSNKAHDGYLGDAVIGQWCNLGAGTSNSNVKNTAGMVTVFNKSTNTFIEVGPKCGVIMGDYSRTAINTSINTGTAIGVCCNVFGERLTPKYIPDFNWGMKTINYYDIGKAVAHISNWKKMKRQNLTAAEINVLKYIFEQYTNKTITTIAV